MQLHFIPSNVQVSLWANDVSRIDFAHDFTDVKLTGWEGEFHSNTWDIMFISAHYTQRSYFGVDAKYPELRLVNLHRHFNCK